MTKHFRNLGFIEATSLLILFFIAMPLKYLAGIPEAVKIVGSIHGMLFVAYCVVALMVANELDWPWQKILLAIVIASIPFGPFIFDKKIFPQPLLTNG